MTINPLPNSYVSQAQSAGSAWDQAAVQQVLQATVSTRKVGLNLGSFGLEYSSQELTFAPSNTPTASSGFDQELELFQLSQHISPFRPAGAYTQSAAVQRQGLEAYNLQANMDRQVRPMISILV